MPTTAITKISFDDASASIQSSVQGFALRDEAGNEVCISLRAVLRCLAIAEKERRIPELPKSFWNSPAIQARK